MIKPPSPPSETGHNSFGLGVGQRELHLYCQWAREGEEEAFLAKAFKVMKCGFGTPPASSHTRPCELELASS